MTSDTAGLESRACCTAMAQVWRERRDEALETAGSVMAAIEHNESFSARGGERNCIAGAGR